MVLFPDENRMILRPLVFSQYRRVRDRRTHRHAAYSEVRSSIAQRDKNTLYGIVTLAAWGIALARRPRTYPLQTGNTPHSQCIAVGSARLRSPEYLVDSVRQSQTFPADVIYGQPLNITWLYHVTGSALTVVGPSLSLVRQSGTRYRIVSATRRSPATLSDNRWRRICFVNATQFTQRSRDASWLCAI